MILNQDLRENPGALCASVVKNESHTFATEPFS